MVEVPAVVLEEEAQVVLEEVVADMKTELEALVDLVMQLAEVGDLLRKLFLGSQEMIIQFLLKFQKHHSFVMGKLMVVTMLIQRQNAKHSTFVPMMVARA